MQKKSAIAIVLAALSSASFGTAVPNAALLARDSTALSCGSPLGQLNFSLEAVCSVAVACADGKVVSTDKNILGDINIIARVLFQRESTFTCNGSCKCVPSS
jgi:hypothetical protein